MQSTSPKTRTHLPFLLITFCLTLSANDCMAVSCNLTPEHELAMSEGMEITVETNWATIKIKAGKGCKRSYTWDGRTAKVKLWPRRMRWFGSYGMVHAAVRPPHKDVFHMIVEEGQQHFQTVEEAEKWMGIDEETTQDLDANAEKNRESVVADYDFYSDDGLVLRADRGPGPRNKDTITINVWQIYIGGTKLSPFQEVGAFYELEHYKKYGMEDIKGRMKIHTRKHYTGGHKPTKLRGSQNSKITVSTPVGK